VVKKKLLLHACCAPCASAVIERLLPDYQLSLFFCNPNIQPDAEYALRLAQFEKLQNKFKFELILAEENFKAWDLLTKEYAEEKEGGLRCRECFFYRLEQTARIAQSYDIFATTLTVSPHKNCSLINTIGQDLAKKYQVNYLVSDFKQNNGYRRSIELAKELGIYRQKYCVCLYSLKYC